MALGGWRGGQTRTEQNLNARSLWSSEDVSFVALRKTGASRQHNALRPHQLI